MTESKGLEAPLRVALAGGRRHGTEVLGRFLAIGAEVVAVFTYPPGNGETEVAEPIGAIAARAGVPVHEMPDLRKGAAKEVLRSARPDVLLAVKWRTLFDQDVLEIPRHGAFVVHDSLLPKLRGGAPMNWAIITGERETGATLIKATLGVDAGPIAAQIATPIGEDETGREIELRMVGIYASLAETLARGLASGDLPLRAQDDSKATFATWRVPGDGRIDWSSRARAIHDLVRAIAPPFPGAHTTVDGVPVILTRTRVLADEDRWVGRVIGRVVRVEKGKGVHVLAGTGTLRVERLLIDGAERAADEVVRSTKATFGR